MIFEYIYVIMLFLCICLQVVLYFKEVNVDEYISIVKSLNKQFEMECI